jgi:hypothetical protein
MKRLQNFMKNSLSPKKSQPSPQREEKRFECRPDWALCYPNQHKSEAWMADFCGVTRLSATSERYWVNTWKAGEQCKLGLKAKDGLSKTDRYQLRLLGPGRYSGHLLLAHAGREFLFRVDWRELDNGLLKVHFTHLEGGRGQP